MTPVIFALPGNEKLARAITGGLDAELGDLTVRRFPDGETYVRFDTSIAHRTVILVCTLDRPDSKFLPLLLSAATARDLGATKIGLIAPYLAYMRQDRRFQSGEGVTSVYFAEALSRCVDWLVTVDPHLHRHGALSKIYSVPAVTLHAAPAISTWIRETLSDPILVGPDSESEQWVAAVAKTAGAPYVVLEKVRRGDRDVEVSVPSVAQWTNRTPVLVDDIISTAHTMIETVDHLKTALSAAPVCVGVHAVFADEAYEELRDAGAGKIVTCNSIPHASNEIDLTAILVDGVKEFCR